MPSIYDARPEDILVDAGKLHMTCSSVYQAVGVSAADADVIADRQVWADLRSVFSHGTRLLPRYVQAFQSGEYNAQPTIVVVRDGPSCATLNADRGIGHVVARRAMAMAIEKARLVGVGVVTIGNSVHFGAASAYSILAAEEGMIGFTTSTGGPPNVVVFGGREPGLSNNPVAWAVPAGPEPPIVLDFGCGVAAHNHVNTLKMYGEPLPAGWMLTKEGTPARTWDEAVHVLPFGGAKGSGISIITSALAALSGGHMPTEKKTPGLQEHFLMALDVGHFCDRDEYLAEIARASQSIRQIPPAPGFDRVYLPGEIEWLRSQRWRETGIPIHRDQVTELERTAINLGHPADVRKN
ncbi:MAG TPA: Ldh family oxidoreductase [Chloroflexota bacterium]|nr:Ldh family oxidoreductase [Chloroflexota bacterium]